MEIEKKNKENEFLLASVTDLQPNDIFISFQHIACFVWCLNVDVF